MASPIKQVSMKCIIMTLLLLFTSTREQQLHGEDGNTLLMMNIIDTLDALSLQLKEHEIKIDAKLEEQERTLETKMEALLEQERNLETKVETLLEAHEVKLEEKLKNLQQCSTRDQLSAFQDLIATDECENGLHNCSELATCTDSCNLYKCACLPGYSGDGFTCEDVDECNENIHTCVANEVCINNPGSFTCNCPDKYFKKVGDICQDVDECNENIHTCVTNEVCINNPGSFTCNCPEKYFKKVGDICQAPVCDLPSLWIPSLGCLTIVKELMSWNDAKSKCQDQGMRLAEGIRREHIEVLVQHFYRTLGIISYWSWVGLRNGRWLTSGEKEEEEVSEGDWEEGYPHGGNEECGGVDMIPSPTGLVEELCSNKRRVLCQSFP